MDTRPQMGSAKVYDFGTLSTSPDDKLFPCDFDYYFERNGYFLIWEIKPAEVTNRIGNEVRYDAKDPSGGQAIALRSWARMPNCLVIVFGVPEDDEEVRKNSGIYPFNPVLFKIYNPETGKLPTKWRRCDINKARSIKQEWFEWASNRMKVWCS